MGVKVNKQKLLAMKEKAKITKSKKGKNRRNEQTFRNDEGRP